MPRKGTLVVTTLALIAAGLIGAAVSEKPTIPTFPAREFTKAKREYCLTPHGGRGPVGRFGAVSCSWRPAPRLTPSAAWRDPRAPASAAFLRASDPAGELGGPPGPLPWHFHASRMRPAPAAVAARNGAGMTAGDGDIAGGPGSNRAGLFAPAPKPLPKAVSGRITARRQTDAELREPKTASISPGDTIESSERPTTVVGAASSGESRLTGPGQRRG